MCMRGRDREVILRERGKEGERERLFRLTWLERWFDI